MTFIKKSASLSVGKTTAKRRTTTFVKTKMTFTEIR